jgi:adenylate cyclase
LGNIFLIIKNFIFKRNLVAIVLWLCTAALFGFLLILRDFGYLQLLELAVYDLLVATVTRDSEWKPPIVVIENTEADIRRLGNWPLNDNQMTDILEKLLASKPRVIGVDIYRDFPVPPGTDKFNTLLTNESRIIFIEKFPTENSQGIPPPPILKDTDRFGFSDTAIDPSGVVRRGLLFLNTETQFGYSFGLRLALAYLAEEGIYPEADRSNPDWIKLNAVTFKPLEEHEGGYANLDAGGYQIMLEYIGGINPFPRFTLSDLWDGRIDSAILRDRIVIFGGASEGVKDQFMAPHSILGNRSGEITGAVVHGHAVRQLLEAALRNRAPLTVLTHVEENTLILIWLTLGLLLGWRSTSPIRLIFYTMLGDVVQIVFCATAFNYGWWIPFVPSFLGWIGMLGLSVTARSWQNRGEQQMLMGLFARQVSPQVAAAIWEHRNEVLEDGGIRPQVLPVTILFSDLQGFTKISDTMSPEPFLTWLNRYLGAMTDVIMEYGGVLDDYAGDGIKANFGVPIARTSTEQISHDAKQAVACAKAMWQELNRLNLESKALGFPCVGMRIGIHSDTVVVGTIGSKLRMKYTTVGSAVNLASRLESIKEIPGPSNVESPMFSCRILISPNTAKLLNDQYKLISQGKFQLRGIQHEVEIFAIAN